MHDVRFHAHQVAMQSERKRKVMLSRTGNIDDVYASLAGDPGDACTGRTDEHRFAILTGKPLDQPDHLLRTAVKVAASLDMNDFQAEIPGIDFAFAKG